MQLEVANIKTHYQVMGNGPTLVLLHGWGHSWETWSKVVAPLSKSFKLIMPDLPAFGQSGMPLMAWNSHDYAQWLQAFLQQVIPQNAAQPEFFLLGHSFGGKVAGVFAAQTTEAGADPQSGNLQKLVIMDASGLPDPLPASKHLRQQLISLIPNSLKNSLPAAFKEKLLANWGLATDHLHATREQKLILRQTIRENIADELAKITTPTLIIWGENDEETPLHQGKRFAQLIPGSLFKIFPTSGHFPYNDETELFCSTVHDFLLS